MAKQGCCCCFGLRGGAKAVGNLFLVITLMQLVGVIVIWAGLVPHSTNVQGFGVDTPEGQFGVQLHETQSVLRGRGEDVTLNLGKFGKFGGSISSDGRVSVRTPGGQISSDGRGDSSLPGLEWIPVIGEIPFTYYVVFVLLALIFNSMLIHGTNHDSSCAVLAWLMFYGAVFVVMTIGFVGLLAVLGLANSVDGTRVGFVAGVGLEVCTLVWYWWDLVLAFYRELRDGTRGYKYQRDVSLQEPPMSSAPHLAA